jgi:drug/metabolite transporter (DMT)-like permease
VLTAPIVGVSSAMILLGEPSTWQKVLSLLMVVTSISVTLMPRADRGRRQVQS